MAQVPLHFSATFSLRMGRGSGADGVSFSYGDLPPGTIGELGAGRGLRVCLRTHTHQRVEVRSDLPRISPASPLHLPCTSAASPLHLRCVLKVWYADALLLAAPAHTATLRSSEHVAVAIEYGVGGLRVAHAGHSYASGLAIPGWNPRPGWRFAIGARSGGESDDHHVDDVTVVGGSAYVPTVVPLSVSLNGLQFSPALSWEYGVETEEEARGGGGGGLAGAA